MKTLTKFKGLVHDFFAVDERTKGFGIEITLALLALLFLGLMFVSGVGEKNGLRGDVTSQEQGSVQVIGRGTE